MNKAFEKILERLDESYIDCFHQGDYKFNNAIDKAEQIVQEVAEECKGDMKHILAEMYAKNMVDYGVDVTKELQTATQQSCALEKAFIRGIQYERDRFIELRKEYNNGWIACSERLPKADEDVLTCSEDGFITVSCCNNAGEFSSYADEYCIKYPKPKVIAWQPLPEPYKESEY